MAILRYVAAGSYDVYMRKELKEFYFSLPISSPYFDPGIHA